MKDNKQMLRVINYWRSSLADAARINIKDAALELAEKINPGEIRAGQISPELARLIIGKQSKTSGNQKIQKASSSTDELTDQLTGEETLESGVPLTADVLICPVVGVYRRNYRLGEQGREKTLTPIWLTAKLSETGAIEPPDDPFVWIPRELLEPSENVVDTIGDVETVDEFVTLYEAPQNAADKSAAPSWKDIYAYANRMLTAVSGLSFEGFKYDDYETQSYSLMLLKDDLTTDKMQQGIIDLYARIKQRVEKNEERFELFRTFTSAEEVPLKPLLTGIENLEKSALHYGQMELKGKFALSPSQREALHHFMTIKDGEILAVNGPPGTGKTTLLQSIVATLWVEAAVEGKRQPPIVVAASTNNQAVTNVITDFGKQPEHKSLRDCPLAGRWLPDITSYGLYCPSASKREAAAALYQTTLADSYYEKNGFFLPVSNGAGGKNASEQINIEDEDFVDKAEPYFMKRCREYAGRQFSTVEEATEFLRLKLISVTDAIRTGLQLYADICRSSEELIHAELLDAKAPIWRKVLSFFKIIKDQKEIIKVKRETAERDLALWQKQNNILNAELTNLPDEVDKELRGKAFQMATHYWEGAWLIEMREQFSGGYEEKKSVYKQEKRWRRYAKIAPCFVGTFHQLPRLFTAYKKDAIPLFGFIDLLIVDEAGQVSPEVAGASFALAKKALVVGDMLQIEPVRQLPPNVDRGNAKRFGLALSGTEDRDQFFDSGLSVSNGSVMKIAQRASKYRKTDERGDYERGMFLAEHRRCLPGIIGYCNELAYRGRLIPKREPSDKEKEKGFCFPAMGYRHIESQSEKIGGSRNNLSEAGAIVQWILNNQEKIKEHYGDNLSEILGIITPFRAQTELIKKELSKYESALPNFRDITVGSVHSLQGAERPIIIFSTVNGTDDKSYFFDGKPNMLNVAVSRAKDSFLVFGNCRIFSSEIAQLPAKLLEKYLLSDINNKL